MEDVSPRRVSHACRRVARPRFIARFNRARVSSPRTVSTSSRYLSMMPSVSSITEGSSSVWSSPTSAAVQSSVSATPGTLYSSAVRSSCTNAVTCSANFLGASVALLVTIWTSFWKSG